MIHTFIIAALSADGFIAKDNSTPSTSWTSKADKKRFLALTKEAEVVIMGRTTFETIGKPLPGRLNVIYTTGAAKHAGAEITSKPPAELLAELEKRGFREAAVCGGASIYTLFMKAGVVDTMYLTIEPVVFGDGIRLFREPIDAKLKLVSAEKVEDSVLFEYTVLK